MPLFSRRAHYPEAYAKGSKRLQTQAQDSPMAQAYRRGRNTSQHRALNPMHAPSANMKLRGFTIPFQNFQAPMGVYKSWLTPSGQRSTGQQRVAQPSLQYPQPVQPIGTGMPWNQS